MRIAVTYENGEIFQHFGKTPEFKFYETDNESIISSKVVSTNGHSHGALVVFLSINHIDVLICGGIGPGAQNALNNGGISLVAGAAGDPDEAVQAYLNGTLESAETECHHHCHH